MSNIINAPFGIFFLVAFVSVCFLLIIALAVYYINDD
jgi:putative copper export protein